MGITGSSEDVEPGAAQQSGGVGASLVSWPSSGAPGSASFTGPGTQKTVNFQGAQKFIAKGRAWVAVWVMGDADHDGGAPIHRAGPGVKILHLEK